MDAKQYWDKYFTEKPYAFGKGPSDFLSKMAPRLQKGKCLDIAMGEGRNAVYLAQRGFQVKGFDISDTAVQHARSLAKDTGVSLEAERADMDMFLMGVMQYDTIVMTHFKPKVVRYYSEMIRALKQGGTLLVESYMIGEMTEPIGKDESYRDEFFGPNELLRHINGLRILFYQEGEVDGHHVVQCLALKPVDKDAAKYQLFDMSSSQTDKGVSKHLELAEKFFKK